MATSGFCHLKPGLSVAALRRRHDVTPLGVPDRKPQSCRVGKIVRGTVAAWARRVHDFAHASNRATRLCPPYATDTSHSRKSIRAGSPGFRHSASIRAFTPVFDGLWTRVNALMAHPDYLLIASRLD
jgi:hypothetical protein